MWTQNYEDIKWVQGASVKTKLVKCRLQDQEDAGTTPEDENSIEGAGGAAHPACGEEPPAAAAAAAAAASPNPPEKAGGKGQKVRG